jgi:hypothetical protein
MVRRPDNVRHPVEDHGYFGRLECSVAGHAVDSPGSLDLKNFQRHRAQLRLMYNF